MLKYLLASSARKLALSRSRSISYPPKVLTAFLTVGYLLLGHVALAQFPINESFENETTPNFLLGGNAVMTGTATTPGYLRLTSAINNQAGYAVLNTSFPSGKGFSVSFEFFSYGGTPTGADGYSVFLMDADGTDPTLGQFNIGAYGGSLGYAQITKDNSSFPGASKGYLGIGLDEFGNYSQANEGRIGGPGFRPQAVALRGPGSGMEGYEYLTGSNTLPFTLNVPTARAQPGSPDYRKAYLYVLAENGGYTITIRIQHGQTVTTTTDTYVVTTPPSNLRVGFAASTGDRTDIHEIRNLAILDNPFAADDTTQTSYNQAVTINVLANDRGIGAEIAPATVDLDLATPGIQHTYTISGQGTFAVDDVGVVTFTPVGTFAGVATLPYVVSDVVDKESNPAILTVNVTGADVASTISGPATAIPGAEITYSITTTNNGSETANNVWPTLQLPPGTSLSTSTDYTYDIATGLVRFSPVTLTTNTSVSNSVTFTVPEPGGADITITASYAYPDNALVPDPVASNNSDTITTTVAASMPVEMTAFEVVATGQNALVTWRTATEQHSSYFTVERSTTGTNFRAIKNISSHGTSQSAHDYSFTDVGAGQLNADVVYYRLRQVDSNGTATYGPVRSVRFPFAAKAAVLYPNPGHHQTLLDLSGLVAGPYLVQVLDLTGRVLQTYQTADQTLPIDLTALPTGAYLVLVQGAGIRQALPLLHN